MKPSSHFDTIDDPFDANEYSKDELDQYFKMGCLEPVRYDINDDNVHDSSLTIPVDRMSQEFCRLSTQIDDDANQRKRAHSTPTTPEQTDTKKRKPLDASSSSTSTSFSVDNLPAFISLESPCFRAWMNVNDHLLQMIGLYDIQHWMYAQYQLEYFRCQRQIYSLYMRAGNGNLIHEQHESNLFVFPTVDRCAWPRKVIDSIHNGRPTTISHVQIDDDGCRDYLRRHMSNMDREMDVFRNRVRTIQEKHASIWTNEVDGTLRKYLEQYAFELLRMKCHLKEHLVFDEYRLTIMERCYIESKATDRQIQLSKDVCDRKYTAERAGHDLLELKLRVFYQRPPVTLEHLETEHERMDGLLKMIRESETNYAEKHLAFEQEYSKVSEPSLTKALVTITEQRLVYITNRLREIYQYRRRFYISDSFYDQQQSNIIFGPTMIVDESVDRRLGNNKDERRLLNRGPTYVPPCQLLSVIESTSSSMDDYFKQLYGPMRNRLAHCFTKYRTNIAANMSISQDLQKKFRELFTVELPTHIRERSNYELSLIDSIRGLIDREQLVLRRIASDRNQFYLGDAIEFDRQCQQRLDEMNVYVRRKTDIDDIESGFEEIVDRFNRQLRTFESKRILTMDIVNELEVKRSVVELPLVYFLPDISTTTCTRVQPRFKFHRSPTMKLANYLERLLRPFVDRTLRSRTFSTPIDFIEKLDHFTHMRQQLRPSTLFCQIDIRNFYHLVTHSTMVDMVGYFIQEHSADNRIDRYSIATIKQFLELFLENNDFRYKNHLFTFTRGSPSSIPLSATLSNIYIYSWESLILNRLNTNIQLYGRYNERILFTWNDAKEKLEEFLVDLQKQQPNVEFDFHIASNASFLGAYIENQQGQLYTCMAPIEIDGNKQKYTLPYVEGHAKLKYSSWLRSSLNRAVCYCTNVNDFHCERVRLELSLLANGYSLIFVERHIHHYFEYFQMKNMRYSNDPIMYHSFRLRWFDIMREQYNKTVRYRTLEQQGHLLRFDYVYELGQRTEFNRYFHRLWSNYMEKDEHFSKDNFLISITTKQRWSLNALLGRYRWFDLNK